MSRRVSLALIALAATLAGCGPEEPTGDEGAIGKTRQRIAAPLPDVPCMITVDGVGVLDLEGDYLPHVITCENGGADFEALKAQAIAARSVAYYSIFKTGSICDSQGCQVYGCGATPPQKAYDAVAATEGMYLTFDSTLTYGFYVAGDKNASPPSCVGSSGATEHYVTYNEGLSGNAVEQTTLGYVGPPGFGQNRGCMSQWGSRCLEGRGYDYRQILQFYYGADIGIITATGCVSPMDRPGEGYIDSASCGEVRGWAWDPDDAASALQVDIWVDVAPGDVAGPTATVTASETRQDLCSAIGSCDHGFTWMPPATFADGASHSVRATLTDGAGATVELTGSPASFTCSGAGGSGASGAGGSGNGGSAGYAGGVGGNGAGWGSVPDGGSSVGSRNRVLSSDDSGCSLASAPRGRSPFELLLILGAGISLRRTRRRRGWHNSC